RDVVSKRVWVIVPQCGSRSLEPADLTALGFAALGVGELAGQEVALYGYDIATYKRTPEWLNAEGWAHPQRWDKFRW
ncbi:MAG: DUF6231 family protein, partial [Gammaproteobacteria bacterium]